MNVVHEYTIMKNKILFLERSQLVLCPKIIKISRINQTSTFFSYVEIFLLSSCTARNYNRINIFTKKNRAARRPAAF
jgi:hypothetical protein